jgi:hypothetical protein
MNWLLPRHPEPLKPAPAQASRRLEAPVFAPDLYGGAPLGVECAWPQDAEREVKRSFS